MPTLYVENVPEDLYDAIRSQAQASRSSISAVVLGMLTENVPTPTEIGRRKSLISRLSTLKSRNSPPSAAAAAAGAEHISAEEMLRQDRLR